MSPKLDPNALPDPSILLESFEHPKHGYLDFDPHTLAIHQPDGKRPFDKPIGLPDQFMGTKQPHVPTCSEPMPGNKGCPKWHGCPLKAFPNIGPGQVIAKKKDAISAWDCFDFFSERDVHGKLIYQINGVEDGWKMDVTRTTTPVMGTHPILDKNGEDTGKTRRGVWQKEWPDLLPYWWPLLKKQGKPLPEAAKRYPQFAEDDEEETSTKSQSPEPSRSVSRGGRKKRRKGAKRSGRGSANARSAPPSSSTPGPDA